jgi:hypothetical protein
MILSTILSVALASSIFQDDSMGTIMILDNSGSMHMNDGKIYQDPSNVPGKTLLKTLTESRWNEMKQKVNDVCAYNAKRKMKTTLHFLHQNARKETPFKLDFNNPAAVLEWINTKKPGGSTPLSETINNIIPDLRKIREPCTLVIFTDGKPDGGLDGFKKTLQNLLRVVESNVAITINLCTDEEEVVDFYNVLDSDEEMRRLLHDKSSHIDVNDDACSESKEVLSKNPWIRFNHMNYIAKLAGCLNKAFDYIDERALSKDEIHLLVKNSPYLFPSTSSNPRLRLPDPLKENFEEYKRVLTRAENDTVARSADERIHLGGFYGEGNRWLTSIPDGHWLDCNYIAKHACGVTMADSAKAEVLRLWQRVGTVGCGRRQRHPDYLHQLMQQQALTGFTSSAPSAPPPATAPEEEDPLIWDEQ